VRRDNLKTSPAGLETSMVKTSMVTAAEQRTRRVPRAAATTVLWTIAFAVISLFVASAAVAQEDGNTYVSAGEGELTVEVSGLAPGSYGTSMAAPPSSAKSCSPTQPVSLPTASIFHRRW